jgi:hypothetical protein
MTPDWGRDLGATKATRSVLAMVDGNRAVWRECGTCFGVSDEWHSLSEVSAKS